MTTFDDTAAQSLLDFWFPAHDLSATAISETTIRQWFTQSDAFDAECRAFEPLVTSLGSSNDKSSVTALATSPKRSLALIILLNQLPRNLFRGSRTIYEVYDPLAEAVASYSTALSDMDLQTKSVAMAQEMLKDVEDYEEGKKLAGMMVMYIEQHKEVIEKFGRFPKRNKVLGRETTEDEKIWLEQTKYDWAK
ncbi:hypothetical protein BDD12DRAFT_869154 [Trichophaea hybrida]|nr:hypothetical protein BDD12DRAFT_869154 [Trichophaea hybrida]